MGLAVLITGERLHLLGERKVLKADEYATVLDADGVLRAAQHEAERLLQVAADEAARRLAAAEAQTLRWREAAEAEGRRAAEQAEADRQLDEALLAREQLHAMQAMVARIVAKGVAQLVAQADPARLFEAALAKVEALVRDEAFVRVQVAPADAPALQTALARLQAQHGWSFPVTWQADASLAPGQCRMQTASGTLALGRDAQLEAFERALTAGPLDTWPAAEDPPR